MTLFDKLSIRGKMLAVIIGITMFSLVFVGGILVSYSINTAREDLTLNIVTLAGMLGDNSRAAIVFQDKEKGREILASLKAEGQVDSAVLFDGKDIEFASYLKNPKIEIPRDKSMIDTEGHFWSEDSLDVVKFIRLDGAIIGKIHLHVRPDKFHDTNNRNIFTIALVILIALLAVYFLAMRFSKIISDPILSLADLTERVSNTNDYSLRGQCQSKDELGVLFARFNEMLSQIQSRKEELRLSNEHLIHAEKLSATGRLSASIAHEFNNPICGIRSVLERLVGKTDLDDNDKIGVDMAIKECTRVANLVKDLNDFHRPSSGKYELTDIHKVINEILVLINKKLNERGIVLGRNYAHNMPKATVVSDQIKQVVLNLLNNAEEAIDDQNDNGRITIVTESVESQVIIRVSDNGCGIPDEIKDKIFDPFVTTKSEVKGVGLGLSISYGIVKSHGGDITVESVPGKGSTLSIILPMGNSRNE